MRTILFATTLTFLLLAGCSHALDAGDRSLTPGAIRKSRTTLVGRHVSVFGGLDRRFDGHGEIDIWLSAAAHNHAFGPERGDYCVRTVDETGTLKSLPLFSTVRATGTLLSDPIPTPKGMDCPTDLVLVVDHAQPEEERPHR